MMAMIADGMIMSGFTAMDLDVWFDGFGHTVCLNRVSLWFFMFWQGFVCFMVSCFWMYAFSTMFCYVVFGVHFMGGFLVLIGGIFRFRCFERGI